MGTTAPGRATWSPGTFNVHFALNKIQIENLQKSFLNLRLGKGIQPENEILKSN